VSVLAREREADILAAGSGRVVRSHRGEPAGRPAHEAAVMRDVRAHGYPARRWRRQGTARPCSTWTSILANA
jgi:hypothetical protein